MLLSDGALHNNNPITELINEAGILDASRQIGCVVSIGTGRTDKLPVGTKMHEVAKNCVQIALDCHEASIRFLQQVEGKKLLNAARYYRFDVVRRMETVSLEDCEKLDDIDEFVFEYMRDPDVQMRLRNCARLLS